MFEPMSQEVNDAVADAARNAIGEEIYYWLGINDKEIGKSNV